MRSSALLSRLELRGIERLRLVFDGRDICTVGARHVEIIAWQSTSLTIDREWSRIPMFVACTKRLLQAVVAAMKSHGTAPALAGLASR